MKESRSSFWYYLLSAVGYLLVGLVGLLVFAFAVKKCNEQRRKPYKQVKDMRNVEDPSVYTPLTDTNAAARTYTSSSTSSDQRDVELFRQPQEPAADATQQPVPGILEDDDKGQLAVRVDDIIGDRYHVLGFLGRGTFGSVAEVYDLMTMSRCALKVINKNNREDALEEVKFLRKLMNIEQSMRYFVQFYDCIEFNHHVCIATEILGLSVYEVMLRNNFQPYDLPQILDIGHQVCTAVNILNRNKLIHTDLKPENILFLDSTLEPETVSSTPKSQTSPGVPDTKKPRLLKNCTIKLIDFGSTATEEEAGGRTITTKVYRAPEVVVKAGWSFPADVWSVGCILIEMYTSNTLFRRPKSNMELLAMMQEVLGPFPKWLAKNQHKYFTNGKLNWDRNSAEGLELQKELKPLKSLMKCNDPSDELFFQLLLQMLTIDPSTRITMAEARSHSVFDDLPVEVNSSINSVF